MATAAHTRAGNGSGAGRPTAVELERRKARVMEVATQLFVANGYAGTSLIDIARQTGHSKPYLRARLPLAFLAPDVQAAILEGRQPADLSVAQVIREDLSMDWADHRRLFGVV